MTDAKNEGVCGVKPIMDTTSSEVEEERVSSANQTTRSAASAAPPHSLHGQHIHQSDCRIRYQNRKDPTLLLFPHLAVQLTRTDNKKAAQTVLLIRNCSFTTTPTDIELDQPYVVLLDEPATFYLHSSMPLLSGYKQAAAMT